MHSKLSPDRIEDILDLTPVQAGMLYQCLLAPEARHYEVTVRLTCSGAFDVERVRRAWNAVAQLHGALRTTLRWEGLSRPVQVVLKRHSVEVEAIDLCGANDEEVQRVRARQAARPVELSDVPFRVELLRLDPERHELVIRYHHIVCDGWSLPVLFGDFFQCYGSGSAASQRRGVAFKEYVKYLKRRSDVADSEFWTRYLAGFAPRDLGVRSTTSKHAAGRGGIRFDTELDQRLSAYCREAQVTKAQVLFAAWGLLLSRYGGAEDVAFGTVVSGRASLPFPCETIVGCFVNTLPLRVRPERGVRFRELVERVGRDLADRSSYEATPFAELRRCAGLPADANLFDTTFAFENYPLDDLKSELPPGVELHDATFEERAASPLTVIVQPGEATRVTLLHDASISGAAVKNVGRHFHQLLEAALASPDIECDAVDMLGEAERSALAAFNLTARPYRPRLLGQVLEEQAERTPAARAIFDGERELGYAELNSRANRLARRLRRVGVERGDVVALCQPRSLELVVGLFAVLKAGGVYLPVDPGMPDERCEWILSQSRPKVVLCSESRDFGDIAVLDFGEGAVRESGENLPLVSEPEDPAYLIYTSGSTGRPNGVVVRHFSVINRLEWMQREFGFGASDVLLQKTPLSFDVSLWELLLWAFAGASLRILPEGGEKDPRSIVDVIAAAGVTTVHFVPSMFAAFLEYLEHTGEAPRLAPLRRIFASGEALEPTHVEAFRACVGARQATRLVNLYGPTEATIDVSWYDATDHVGGAVPIGRPIQNVRLHVVNRALRELPPGLAGELAIAGDGLALGYFDNPALTEQKFVPSPFEPGARLYLTGDLARRRADGEIEFLGRLDHQLKLNGHRIELGEVEQTILRVPGVTQAGVVARETASGKELVAFYRGDATISALRAGLVRSLPDSMIPRWIHPLDVIPLTASGKLDRKALLRVASALGPAAPSVSPRPTDPRSPGVSTSEAAAEIYERVREAWRKVLPGRGFSSEDRFFDVGGDSIALIRLMASLAGQYGDRVTIATLSRYPSIRAFGDYLSESSRDPFREASGEAGTASPPAALSGDVAIVGMACSVPGASDLDEFWRMLSEGASGLTRFESCVAGMTNGCSRHVPVKGCLADADKFDAEFFGYNGEEARLMDPQLRVLHECVWLGLEDAGLDPATQGARIGLYVGASPNFHWLCSVRGAESDALSDFNLMLLNEKDFFSGRIAYKLDLRGPSVTVQTACSTSAVAIHQACRDLIGGECNVAVAGGVSVTLPLEAGYSSEDGMILSPDGTCRPFDAEANGTVPGNGVGVVVLKRAADAIADGNTIYAIIKGSAINNDGRGKLGITAPSVEGQASCIRMAHRRANVDRDSIAFVEAHGTGTPLGDPIELEALALAFEGAPARSCAVGSVKGNVGHLDAAAGVVGVIKTALALHHGAIPPTLHYRTPNPSFDLSQSPFEIPSELRAWSRGGVPRRAGVSSFGMSGTNCHLVLEEAPIRAVEPGAPLQVLTLSARTQRALEETRGRLGMRLATLEDVALPDVAHTLQRGRRAMQERAAVVASSRGEAMHVLADASSAELIRGRAVESPQTVLLFQGQGRQIENLGRALYEEAPEFREPVERCFSYLQGRHRVDLRDVLFPRASESPRKAFAPLALFVFQCALVELLQAHGVKPVAVLGHSVGEYAAAVLSGIFSLEGALDALCARCRLIEGLPGGAMIATDLAPAQAQAFESADISLAAVNSPSSSVLSGEPAAIATLAEVLERSGHLVRKLATVHAFHSPMLDPILPEYRRVLSQLKLAKPRLKFVTSAPEQPTAAEFATAEFWVAQTRKPVWFAAALEALKTIPRPLFLEIGGAPSLSSYVRRQVDTEGMQAFGVVEGREPLDRRALMRLLARLWTAGVEVDFGSSGASRRLISLPGYPFARRSFPCVSAAAPKATRDPAARQRTRRAPNGWFHVPYWDREPEGRDSGAFSGTGPVLCFEDEAGLGLEVARALAGDRVVSIRFSEHFVRRDERHYHLDFSNPEHLAGLFEALPSPPNAILHAALLRRSSGAFPDAEVTQRSLDRGYYALMSLAKVLARSRFANVALVVLTANSYDAMGGDLACPDQATVRGATKILALEDRRVQCKSLDLDLRREEWDAQAVAGLVRGLPDRPMLCMRNGRLWACDYRHVEMPQGDEPDPLRSGGVYLVTGGLGGVGFEVAAHLARSRAARLTLVGRSLYPERTKWSEALGDPTFGAARAERIRRMLDLEAGGAEFEIARADVTDAARIDQVIAATLARRGRIDGIFHAAGLADYSGLLQTRDRASTDLVLAPKIAGARNLVESCLRHGAAPDVMVLFSSIGNVVHELKYGQSGYNAANEFLDASAAFSGELPARHTVSINWPDFRDVGMSLESAELWANRLRIDREALLDDSIDASEGVAALQSCLRSGRAQVVVCPAGLEARRDFARSLLSSALLGPAAAESGPASILEPGTDVRAVIVDACRDILGLDRIDTAQSFFQMGASSFDMIRINTRIGERLGRELSVVEMYEHHSVDALAAFLLASSRPRDGNAELRSAGADSGRAALKKTVESLRARRGHKQ